MAERPLKLVPPDAGRAAPWDQEAEYAVLGGCLMDEGAAIMAAAVVKPEHFYRQAHRRLFDAMLAVAGRDERIDPVTLGAELSSRGEYEDVGGVEFISELLDVVPTAANIEYHARVVVDCARRRQLISVGTEIVRNAYEPDGLPVSLLVDRAEQLVSSCADGAPGGGGPAKTAILEVFERVEALEKNPGKLAGVSWGLDAVDQATGGLHKGNLVVVAARPSMGKTAFVTGAALAAAVEANVPAAIFTLEMSRREVVERCLCSLALVDLSRLLSGRLREDDYGRLAQAAGHLNTAPLWIDDTGGISVAELRAKLRVVKQDMPDLGLVVVDYIQLMRGTKSENRTQEVSSISRDLKSLAKEFDVPLVALSQLSRAPEARSNHRPQLSDLRESGSIEQDADMVGFLYREEYYLSAADAQEAGKVGAAEFIIGKQRNGPTGTIDLFFRKECARFETPPNPNWGNRS